MIENQSPPRIVQIKSREILLREERERWVKRILASPALNGTPAMGPEVFSAKLFAAADAIIAELYKTPQP